LSEKVVLHSFGVEERLTGGTGEGYSAEGRKLFTLLAKRDWMQFGNLSGTQPAKAMNDILERRVSEASEP